MSENVIRILKPRTEAQRAAARANGAKSQGPATEEGKAKSALNALRHGLLANSLVLTTESEPKFNTLLEGYLAEYQPEGQTEHDMVQEIVASKWLQQRCWILTTCLLNVTMDNMAEEIARDFVEIDTGTRTALAFLQQADHGAALALMNRYAARHSREWHRAIDKLRAIQKERREQSEQPDSPLQEAPNEPDPDQTPEPSTASEVQLAADHRPPATELATQPPVPSTDAETELVTRHSPLITGSYCPKPADLPPQSYSPDSLPSPKLEKEENLDPCD